MFIRRSIKRWTYQNEKYRNIVMKNIEGIEFQNIIKQWYHKFWNIVTYLRRYRFSIRVLIREVICWMLQILILEISTLNISVDEISISIEDIMIIEILK